MHKTNNTILGHFVYIKPFYIKVIFILSKCFYSVTPSLLLFREKS